MTTEFNWSWISSTANTLKSSVSIDQSNGIFYSYRAADRGVLSAADLRTSLDTIGTNINHQWRLWQNNIRPILDSLPAGSRDTRWRYGKGLPTKIDALNYGVQGTTLFVFNDADATKASGRYWHLTDERPLTIAEAIEDLWTALSDLDITSISTGEDVNLEPLWAAIGHHYKDSSLTSLATSLDSRTSVLESYLNQLRNDIYGNDEGYTSYTFGAPLLYSIAQNIDYLLQIHNVTGWQADPSEVSHDGLGGAELEDHEHPYTDILPMPSVTLTQGRTTPYTSLYNDILRIRYEIQQTRGSTSWYTDATDPVTTSAGNLSTHMNYVGNGTSASNNPHGLNYEDIGVDEYLENIANFIGMGDYTIDEFPSYTSTNYITQSSTLEIAISDLDAAINDTIAGFVSSVSFGPEDRSSMSEATREITPITITHNRGALPASVNVIDLSPESTSGEGMYSSPLLDVICDFPDNNTVRFWTAAAIVSGSILFDGPGSISSEIGGVTLSGAYNYGGGGNGRSIVADSGAVTISATVSSNNNVLEISQNDTANKNHALRIASNINSTSNFYDDGYAIYINGTNTSGQTIWSDSILNIGNEYDLEYRNYLALSDSFDIVSENILTGDTTILISSLGSSTGDGYLNLNADVISIGTSDSGVIGFADSNFDSSTWTTAYLPFAATVAEYNTYKTNLGEISLLNAINTLYDSTLGDYYFVSVAAASYSFSEIRNSILAVPYTATGTVSIDLSSSSAVSGRMVIIKDTGNNASSNNITITTEGSETIDGSATATISSDRGSLILVYDGTSDWMIIS